MSRKFLILFLFVALSVAACGSSGNPGPDLPLPATDLALCVTLGVDYRNNVGTMAVVGLPSLTVLKNLLPGAVAGDPVVRLAGGKIYVINRYDNNVTVIDAASFTVEKQFSTGADSDPQDIAVAGTKAYVPLYKKAVLQVWDLSQANPAAPAATIDLGSYDPDGVPQANSVAVAGGKAYVTLDLLDGGNPPKPRGNGKIVVIDTTSNAVAGTMDLNYANPYDFMVPFGDKLLVATLADFSGTMGCLEQIDTQSPSQVGPCLVENRALGGTISAIAVTPDKTTFVAVSAYDAAFNQTASLRRIDSAGHLDPAALTAAPEVPTDVAWAPSNHLVYADAKSGGIRIYDLTAGHELTTDPLNIGLGPVLANGIVCMSR